MVRSNDARATSSVNAQRVAVRSTARLDLSRGNKISFMIWPLDVPVRIVSVEPPIRVLPVQSALLAWHFDEIHIIDKGLLAQHDLSPSIGERNGDLIVDTEFGCALLATAQPDCCADQYRNRRVTAHRSNENSAQLLRL